MVSTKAAADAVSDRSRSAPAPLLSRLGLVVALGAALVVVLDFSIVNVALPSLSAEMGVSTMTAEWVVTAYALTFGGLLVVGGRASDLFGRPRLLVVGLVLFAAASVAGGVAVDFPLLVAARAVQGLAAAMIAPAALSILTTSFPEGPSRERVIGYYGMTASIGFVVGLVAGGVLVDTVGWRGVFFVNVPLCLALAIVAPSALPGGTTTAGARHLDLPGALLVTAGMATLVYAPTVGTRDGWASVEFAACVLASAALLAAFVHVERRGRQPILPLSILRHHTLVIGDALMVLVGALMAGEVLVLTLYAQQVLGYSALVSGLIAIPQGIGGLLRGLVAARLLDRAGLRWFLVANWALAALSILVLFRFPATSHYPLLGIVLLGVGFGSTNVIFGGTIAGSAGVSNDEQGSAGALVNAARQIGAAIGVAVVLSVAAAGGQTSASGGASAAGYRLALLCWAGVAGAAAVLSLALPGRRRTNREPAPTTNAPPRAADPRAQIFQHRHDQKEPTMTDTSPTNAANAGILDLAGDLTVHRLGYGAMRITGEGIWGEPSDREGAKATLRRAVELGVNFIDTADAYGPEVSETLIAEALHPYPDDLVIATKGGLERPGPGRWTANGQPEHLRAVCEGSLQRLRLDQIPLYQFHRPDPDVPLEESIGALVALKDEGKIEHIGVCNFTEEQLRRAQQQTPIVSVQNRYNATDRTSETMVDLCEQEGLTFLPWAPVLDLDRTPVVQEIADGQGATARQVALAWLLARSPVILPIPGTSSVTHLETNVAATGLELAPGEVAAITARRASDS